MLNSLVQCSSVVLRWGWVLGPADEVTALGQPPMKEATGTERYQVLGQFER